MAGILDFMNGQSGDGSQNALLEFLRANALNQQSPSGLPSDTANYGQAPQSAPAAPPFSIAGPNQPSPLDTAQWPAGPVGAPSNANAAMPPPITGTNQTSPVGAPSNANAAMPKPAPMSFAPQPAAAAPAPPPAAPQPAPVAAPAPQDASPGGLGAGVRGFLGNLQTGPIGAIVGGIGSAMGMQDPAKAVAAQKANMTAQYLRKNGISEEAIGAAVGNGRVPGDPEVLKTILSGLKDKTQVHPATAAEKAAAGIPAETPLFLDENGKPTFAPASTNVNVNTEKTGQAELAKTAVEEYKNAQASSRESQKRLAMYDAFEKAAQGFTPGATAEMRLTAKRYLKDAGLIKGEDVPDGEIQQMIGRQLAIHAQPKGQGAVSNYERQLYASALPSMIQSPEGLTQAIGINRKLEQFDQRVAEIWRNSARDNKGIPNYLDVQDKIAALGSPLGDGDMAAIQPSSGAPPAAAAPAAPAKAALAPGNYVWTPGKGLSK